MPKFKAAYMGIATYHRKDGTMFQELASVHGEDKLNELLDYFLAVRTCKKAKLVKVTISPMDEEMKYAFGVEVKEDAK